MGKPMQDIFLEFEPQPMASASIGQVPVYHSGNSMRVVLLDPYLYRLYMVDTLAMRDYVLLALRIMPWYFVSHLLQVHRAVLKDGREVAVKVMYPTVERLFRGDVKNLEKWCR